jgi:hypothetical protein
MGKTASPAPAPAAADLLPPADAAGAPPADPPAPPPADPPAPPPTDPPPAAEPALTEARVLIDCQHGKVDAVVALTDADLAEAVALGVLDPHPDAVAYAKSLAVLA